LIAGVPALWGLAGTIAQEVASGVAADHVRTQVAQKTNDLPGMRPRGEIVTGGDDAVHPMLADLLYDRLERGDVRVDISEDG
jgi:hypothetical protein